MAHSAYSGELMSTKPKRKKPYEPAHEGGVEYWGLQTYSERVLGWWKTEIVLPMRCPGCVPTNIVAVLLLPIGIPMTLLCLMKRWNI